MATVVKVHTFAGPAATGLLDVTTAALGGLTPTGFIIFGGSADPTHLETANVAQFFGWARAGAAGACIQAGSSDAAGTSGANRSMFNGSGPVLLSRQGAGTTTVSASVSAFITNGVRLNFTTNTLGSKQYTIVFFAGAEVSMAIGQFTPAVGANPANVINTLTFAPDLVCIASAFSTALAANNGDAIFSIGWADRVGGKNYSTQWGETSGTPSASNPQNSFFDSAVSARLTRAVAAVTWTGAITAWTANGFTHTITGTTTAAEILIYLAFKFDDAAVHIGEHSPPAATGPVSYTDPAFEPQAVLFNGSSVTTKNVCHFNTAPAAGLSWAAMDATEQNSNSFRDDFSQDPTVNKQQNSLSALTIPQQTDCDAVNASFVSLDPTGYTLNYTAVVVPATFFYAVSIEGTGPPPADPPRVAQGVAKFAMDLDSTPPRIAQGIGKFALNGIPAPVRIQQGVAKFAVRVYPKQSVAKVAPSTKSSQKRAPYISTYETDKG